MNRITRSGVVVSVIVAAGTLGLAGTGGLISNPAQAASINWYQGKLVNADLVLGPQSQPTLVVKTPALPKGQFAVHAVVGMVTGTNDQTVCAVSPSSDPAGNDGTFGTTGNGSSATYGGSPVYGNAVIEDIVTVPQKGDTLQIWCNAYNYGHGTYAGNASIVAQVIGTADITSSSNNHRQIPAPTK